MAPKFNVNCGVPKTITPSLKLTCRVMTDPTLYDPSTFEELTDVTTGAVVSIQMALFAPSDPAAPGAGSVSVAAFVARSVIVPTNDVVLA